MRHLQLIKKLIPPFKPFHPTLLAGLVIFSWALIACNSATPPAPTAQKAAEVVETPTNTATPAPTVAVSTPTSPPPTTTDIPATPTPRPTATPVTTPTPPTYVVKEGDTLLGIATELGTTLEALAETNEIGVDDFIQPGQELVIPVVIEPTTPATPTVAATPTSLTVAATPTSPTAVTPAAAENQKATQTPANAAQAVVSTATPAAPPPASQPAVGATMIPIPTFAVADNVNPLTGLPVADPSALRRRPLMVRVGNDVGARPQIGLNSADIVYEEITEWWVTRFTAIYLANTPPAVGPVRSGRLLNVQLVPQYQGALAHSGGSDPVRWEISQAPLVNLDEFYNAAPYFYREGEGWATRLAIDTQAARDYMRNRDLDAPVDLPAFFFSDTLDEGGEAGPDLYIPYPRSTSFTEWHYDPASGQYLRWISGYPLYDAAGGQIAASNVIVYFADHLATDIVEDSNGATSIRIFMNGFNAAWLFRDGRLYRGFWQTQGDRPPYFTYPDDRKPYHLKPGNTWIEVVPLYYKIGLNSADEASAKP
jgi:LysM repeat protein